MTVTLIGVEPVTDTNPVGFHAEPRYFPGRNSKTATGEDPVPPRGLELRPHEERTPGGAGTRLRTQNPVQIFAPEGRADLTKSTLNL